MDAISLNNIVTGSAFTEDSYILEDLFFLPKNLPVEDYHIKLLREWNINDIFTEGRITERSMNKIIQKKPDIKQKIEDIYEAPAILSNTKDTPESTTSEQTSINTVGLLDNSVKVLVDTYKNWIKTTINIFNEILIQRQVDKEKPRNLIKEIIDTVNKNKNNALMLFGKTFEGLLYIYPQTIETVILAYIIGDSLNLSQLALSNLAIATLFHDIGMLKIPRIILEKKEALSEHETSIIQNHPNIGYKFLRDVKYSAIIASGALQHHERIDGKGYPNGLLPDRITDIAKVISVVDAYCAAIANKPFKKSSMHAKEVIQDLLRGGGTAYDPSILKELIKNISFYPIGSLVLLSTDKPARVVGTSGVAMKPIVKKIDAEAEVIDLSKTNDIYIKGLYSEKN
ncbi:MAG: HD domain-containing protein [Spirochaetes bacterium]|nr:HD domain-containing protein [Spirochaetota bacterium]